MMQRHYKIPCEPGLYWYYETGCSAPEAVNISPEKYGDGKFRGFNGRLQGWLQDGEFLVGPQPTPNALYPGANRLFTKSGNKVRLVAPIGDDSWRVERVDGASVGKQMICPSRALVEY